MKPKEISTDHKELLQAIGNRIRKLREETGQSYIQIAKEIGISRNSYNQVENGRVYFNISSLLLILEFHHLSLGEFIHDL